MEQRAPYDIDTPQPRASSSPLAGEGRGEWAPAHLGDTVDIPADILVRCPLRAGNLRQAKACDTCPHCAGLALQLSGAHTPFHHRYAVRCTYPIDRELFRLAAD